ncbi:hypothetical protein A2U01_0077749, partial [Trifolium medium]|nr:hypothetical protein [Trifolium medium]
MARLDRLSIERVMAILVGGMLWAPACPGGHVLAQPFTRRAGTVARSA